MVLRFSYILTHTEDFVNTQIFAGSARASGDLGSRKLGLKYVVVWAIIVNHLEKD
jgi:hypothetical protein